MIEHQLEQINQGISVQLDVRLAIMWAAGAWVDVTSTTIVNCWRKVGILPGESVLCTQTNQAMQQLTQLLLHFSAASHETLCNIEDCEEIPGENIVEEEFDDFDDDDGGQGAAGGDGGAAVENVENDPEMEEEAPRVVTLRNARVAAQDVLYFLMDNQDQRACNVLSEKAGEISEHLKQMTISSRLVQQPITAFFDD